MKKTLVLLALILVVLLGLFAITFPKGDTANTRNELIDSLPTDSGYAGSYYVTRSFKGQAWGEGGKYTPEEAYFRPCVDVDFGETIVINNRADYVWIWEGEGVFNDSRFCLEKR